MPYTPPIDGTLTRHPTVRSLLTGLQTDELPGEVVDLAVYLEVAALKLNAKYPEYDTLVAPDTTLFETAFHYQLALELIPYCRGRLEQESSHKSSAKRTKVDWTELGTYFQRKIKDLIGNLPDLVTPLPVFKRVSIALVPGTCPDGSTPGILTA